MRKLPVKLGLLAIVLAGCLISVMQMNGGQTTMPEQKDQTEIDREKAIEVAQAHATKAQVDTSRYLATACEMSSLWRVYLEPTAGGDVLEYAVSKRGGGVVLTSAKWSGTANVTVPGAGSAAVTIDQAQAIAVAKKDAQRVSDLSKKELTVCELKSFWKIIYSPPAPINGGGPEYLIDKRTGVITDKKYYQ